MEIALGIWRETDGDRKKNPVLCLEEKQSWKNKLLKTEEAIAVITRLLLWWGLKLFQYRINEKENVHFENEIYVLFLSNAAGRTRTGTVSRLILSQVRLPIPPQWHMRLHERHHTILWKQMQEVFAKAHGKCTWFCRRSKSGNKGVSRRRKNGLSYRTLCIKRQEAGNIVGKESNCEKKTGKSANWFSMTYSLKY